MKYFLSFILTVSFFFSYSQDDRKPVVSFEDSYKRDYKATKIASGQPKIDGKLDEGIWTDQGEWSEKFAQVIPFERAYTGSWTRMKIFYDDKNIYVGVYGKDIHPETMNAFIGNGDEDRSVDVISVAFGPYDDDMASVEINIDLAGKKTDVAVSDELSVNLSWNAVWEGKPHQDVADSSWTAELRIPFNQIRYTQKNDDGIWGLHVRRIIRKNNEVQNWSMIPIKN